MGINLISRGKYFEAEPAHVRLARGARHVVASLDLLDWRTARRVRAYLVLLGVRAQPFLKQNENRVAYAFQSTM